MPVNCPACGSPVVRDPAQVAIRCVNASCPAQLKRRIEHFASRGAMDIEGLGEAMVQQLVDRQLTLDLADIYRLDAAKLGSIPRTGDKSIGNLLEAVVASKARPLWRLIFGLGILHVGATSARALAEVFIQKAAARAREQPQDRESEKAQPTPLDELMEATAEELQFIPDVGPIVGPSIAQHFDRPENRAVIERLRQAGLNFGERDERPQAKEAGAGGKLAGSTWVITGTLSEPREQIAEQLRQHGGKTAEAVSKKTTYLLAGEQAGSKLAKARKLGVRVITEKEFRELLGD
jgi:DNA ligase (NAD+)